MFDKFPLFPEQASSLAGSVDHFLYFMIAVSVFFTVVICAFLLFFAIKYRQRPEADEPHLSHEEFWFLEVLWIVVPMGLATVMFFWGTKLFFEQTRQPKNAMEILVVGKQWMWKLQHLNGRREINELHVPVGQTVKLTMGTQDVIHSFYVPAFRMKQDVVPGRFTTTWFKATKPGKYHLFCAEYCGTNHSRMIGSIYVMEPSDFQEWLSGTTGSTPAEAGKAIFESQACITCHSPGSGARGPNLVGLFGTEVRLQGGNTVTADENYIRESILNPQAKIVHGYQPIMPTFKGLINEEQVMQLTAYIKSMKSGSGEAGVGSTQQVAGPAGQLPPHVARETLMQTNKPESEQPAPSVPSPTPATIEIKSAPSQATPGPGTIQTTEPQGASSVPVDQGTTSSRQESQ